MGQSPKTLDATLPIIQLDSLPLKATPEVSNTWAKTTRMALLRLLSQRALLESQKTLNNMMSKQRWSSCVNSVESQFNIYVNHDLPLSGRCCLRPLQTAGLGSPRAPPAQDPGPAPDWPCYCPCYEVSGEAISSTGDCTASHPLLCPHLLPAPARMCKRPLRRQEKKV